MYELKIIGVDNVPLMPAKAVLGSIAAKSKRVNKVRRKLLALTVTGTLLAIAVIILSILSFK